MRPLAPLLIALLAAACAGGPVKTEITDAADPLRYRRVGVLPFSDTLGGGRRLAELLGRGLFRLGFDVSDMSSIETVFARLDMDYSGGLSLQDLADIRRTTYVDAIIFGTVDSAPASADAPPRLRKVALIMLDAENGDIVLRTDYVPKGSRDPRRPEGIVEEILFSMKRELERRSQGAATRRSPEELP